jgi:L-alanine-DL-glutamate epimerase-like enolase superfamily enzyme
MTATSRRGLLSGLGAAAALRPIRALANAVRSKARVTGVETFRLKNAILLKVAADYGLTGWGEASPNNTHLVETFVRTGLRQHVIGRNIWDAEPIWDDMFFDNHDLGPQGVLTYAMAGIDCALWDLRGKTAGMPVHRLLGGAYRNRIKAYGSFGVDGGLKATPAQAAAKAVKFVERGFGAVKLRMQIRERNINPQPDPTLAYARAVRKAVGGKIELIVDINNGYTAARAIEIGRQLSGELGVRYFEEPVSTQNLHELAQVSEALDIAVIAGEKEYTRWQHRALIEQGQVDILNPDVTKCGGITEAKKIAALAQAAEKPVVPHNTRPTLSTAAALHFAASISNAGPFVEFADVDEFAGLMGAMKSNVEFKDGYLMVPQQPGLGIEPDEAAIRRLIVPE